MGPHPRTGEPHHLLLVAPQPFYQERGTPIAVRLFAETVCELGHRVDLLTYHEGEDVACDGLTVHRIPHLPGVNAVPIGFSWKKLLCDSVLSVELLRLARAQRYSWIQAVEEAIFPASLAASATRTPLVYDMDSSMAAQLCARWPSLRSLRPLLHRLERLAVRRADAVVAVCPALAEEALRLGAKPPILVLEDCALPRQDAGSEIEELRDTICGRGEVLALYVGNVERHQGIGLLIEAVARLPDHTPLQLAVIGGPERAVRAHREMVDALDLGERVHFLGPRSVDHLLGYLDQADVLLSPRLAGMNTPMKLYTYLAAGKPILATGIRAHTQVLDDSCAVLVPPDPDALSAGLLRLVEDVALRRRLGREAKARFAQRYSLEAFRGRVSDICGRLGELCDQKRARSATVSPGAAST